MENTRPVSEFPENSLSSAPATPAASSPAAPPTVSPVKQSQFSPMSFVLGVAALGLIGVIVAAAFWAGGYGNRAGSNQALTQREVESDIADQNTQPADTTDNKITANEKTFQDSRLTGFTFTYDGDIWSELKPTSIDSAPATQGWSMTDSSGGRLEIAYTLPFGQGGALYLVTQDELHEYQPNKFRTRSQNTYTYGTKFVFDGHMLNVKEFAKDGGKDEALAACNEQSSPDFEGMPIYREDDCPNISNGTAVAEVQIPSFYWSHQFGRVSPLADFNPEWHNDEYIEQTGLSNRPVIAVIRYTGSHPEWADEIVAQLNQ